MKFAICQIPLFDRHVVAVMDCTEQEALLKFTDYTRENTGEYADLELLENAKGWCQVSGGDVYVWAKDSVAVLFHELVHAAFALCRQIDLSLDEELIARLVAYMKLHLVDPMTAVEMDTALIADSALSSVRLMPSSYIKSFGESSILGGGNERNNQKESFDHRQ